MSSAALWYLGRGTGAVSLILLTIVVDEHLVLCKQRAAKRLHRGNLGGIGREGINRFGHLSPLERQKG